MERIGRLIPTAAFVAAAAVILGGCQYLFGYPFGPMPSEPLPSGPRPSALYTTGTATITIGTDPAIVLGTLVEGGGVDPEFGVGATFRNDDGWYLRIMGATGDQDPAFSPAFVSIERIADHQHWSTSDSVCVTTVAKADATGLSGRATCKAARWTDAMTAGLGNGYQPPDIKGQDPFDAVITFEAKPGASSPSVAPASTQAG